MGGRKSEGDALERGVADVEIPLSARCPHLIVPRNKVLYTNSDMLSRLQLRGDYTGTAVMKTYADRSYKGVAAPRFHEFRPAL